MNPTAASQIDLDNALLSSYYPAFLITIGVPEIYMHQFWNTVTKVKDSSSYQFKLDNKKFRVNAKVFRDILQICLKLPDQPFAIPPSTDEEIIEHLQLSSTGAFLGKPLDLINLGCQELKFCGGCITTRMWILLNYSGKTLLSRSIITSQRKACPILDSQRSSSITSSHKIQDYPSLTKKPTNKHGKAKKDVTSTKKTATEPKPTKKKTPVRAGRGKGLNVLSKVALSEAPQLKEVTKQSKKDFHISHASGLGDRTDFELGVPDEQQRKISEEEEDDDDDTKDDDDNDGNDDGDDSDGNDDDDDNDGNDDDDSEYERTESDRDENSNLIPSNKEHEEEEEEYVDEFTDKEDDDDNAKEENEEALDDAEELYKD
ncbi:hypothetical protein Tco_1366023, partial [Tanacetum coccineum]